MARRVRGTMGLVIGLLGLAVSVQAASDVVLQRKGARGPVKTHKGTIIRDDFSGVTIQVGSTKVGVPRNEVVEVTYAKADNRAYKSALDKYRQGDYEAALRQLDVASNRITNMPASQRNLFGQYVRYYKAQCYYGLGSKASKEEERKKQWSKARDDFSTLIARVKDTAFYFDAMLTDAQCLEAISISRAKERYGFLVNDFTKKIKDSRCTWAQKYVFQAKMGQIRVEMRRATQGRGKEEDVEKLLKDLGALEASEDWKAYADMSVKVQATDIQAMGLRYLKRWAELIEILNSQVRMAQRQDRNEDLGRLYRQRGDAYYQLAAGEKVEAAKRDKQERALFDYLRLALVFPVAKEDAGELHVRIARLAVTLQIDGWKKITVRHLALAKKYDASGVADVEAMVRAAEK